MYDLIIIGGGPAGLSAAVYAARYKMNVIVLAQKNGGYAADAHLVENWLGERSIKGADLTEKFIAHVKAFDIEIANTDVKSVVKTDFGFEVTTDKEKYQSKRILIATGTERNKLGIKGEEEFLGKGVSYCATCDGFFFRDKVVAVIGGGDSAATSALALADIAGKVYLVHRREELRAVPSWQEQMEKNPKIEYVLGVQVTEIVGQNVVEKIVLNNGKELAVNGVFIEVGSTPAGAFINQLGVKTDDHGYVVVDDSQRTNVQGVFAAGDITTGSSKLKQMIVAAAEGAVATYNAYLEQKTDKE